MATTMLSNTVRSQMNVIGGGCDTGAKTVAEVNGMMTTTTTRSGSDEQSDSIETVYIRNLEEHVKPDQLKTVLYIIFSEYGTIIDIVAKRNIKAKGQAFVIFDSAAAAARAAEEVDGFEIFGKPMMVSLAKSRSDASVQRQGDPQAFEAHKDRRLADKERKKMQKVHEMKLKLAKRVGELAKANLAQSTKLGRSTTGPEGSSVVVGSGQGLKSTAPTAAVISDEYLPPNKVLFVQSIPSGHDDIETLTGIFSGFEGFVEIRLVPGRGGIAFIEYEEEAGAISAKEHTAGMVLGNSGKAIKVTFRRH